MTAPSDSQPNLPPHRKVHVDLGPRSYDVLIGRGLLEKAKQILQDYLGDTHLFLIADENVALKWSSVLEKSLNIFLEDSHIVFSGERTKALSDQELLQEIKYLASKPRIFSGGLMTTKALNRLKKLIQKRGPLKSYNDLISQLAQRKVPRTGTIIALGGGVIGDLAGFVAATYLRGINFVQVPTTLLAMVDSSVGGKTGVNLPEGKNLVGAFHQPKLVVADLDTLKTLPPREFSAGMAEVIKYGAIRNKALFDRVAQGVNPDDADLDEIIKKCVEIKARIVENDEFETKGERALLNFGHTIGHAIEAETEYKEYLHGEAIALGMRAAAWLSHVERGLSVDEVFAIENALVVNGLNPQAKERYQNGSSFNSSQIFSFIGRDKKIKDGVFQWVLSDKIGQAQSGCATPSDKNQLIENIIKHLLKPIGTKFFPTGP